MPRRFIRRKKVLQVIQQIVLQIAGGIRTKAEAETLQKDLKAQMRTFGRQCRGKGKVYLKWAQPVTRAYNRLELFDLIFQIV